MKILVSWLREYVNTTADVQTLADVLTMRGFEVSSVDPPPGRGDTSDDAVLDLEVTTNRPDCLNVVGVAREVATVYELDLRPPVAPDVSVGSTSPDLTVTIEDPELCPRYAAAVAEVTPGPSPAWLATRLEAAGVRPINNIVDVTNYVMLELGHPMHAFDLDRLGGHALRIRRARAGEHVRTLDGQNRALEPEMLVIADDTRAQAVAGVMGGADSEVSQATRRIALESAYFRPTSVRRTSKRLGLSTDASYRFERGADVDAPVAALRRALGLLTEHAGAEVREPLVDAYPAPVTARQIRLRHARIERVLGLTIETGFVSETLARLGFAVSPVPAAAGAETAVWDVRVPSFRVDVSREIDLVEEVARHHGYDRLPSTFPPLVRAPAAPRPSLRRHQILRQVLTAQGCSEAITYSFIERRAALPFVGDERDLAAIANPLSEKFTVLRPSLLPGLLDSLVRNRHRERPDVRLFEIGKRFTREAGERPAVGVMITGAGAAKHWSGPERPVDLFDMKGIVEAACDALGIRGHLVASDSPVLVEGRAARVTAGEADDAPTLGLLGQLRPELAAQRGLTTPDDEIYLAELDLAALAAVAVDRHRMTATPVPRYPSVVRDLALVIDRALPAAALRGTIRTAAPETLESVWEFDRYEGKGVADGHVSLALRLTFRAPERTLTDAEVQDAVDRIVTVLHERHQATLR